MSVRNEPEITTRIEYGAVWTRRTTTGGDTVVERVYVGPWTRSYAEKWVKRTSRDVPGADAKVVTRTIRTETTAWY
jgi:hypothetical protein